MPITSFDTDVENLTMTVAADFAAPLERLWRVYTDPRQLERFWGPPGWPATFTQFDFTVGGRAFYHMTSPQGEVSRGSWEFLGITAPDAPNAACRFEVLDAFVDAEGTAFEDFPAMRMTFDFIGNGDESRMVNTTFFASVEALEQAVAMGAVEGTKLAMSQIDAVLEDLRDYAQGKGTRVEILDDQHVRITRLINGPRDLVWRAHQEPELMKKWMLGPEGWRMSICDVAPEVGGRYQFEWEPLEGVEGERFGFDGETLVSEAPRRAVTTEHMTGTDYPSTVNDLSLYEEDGATLITTLIEYPDAQTRDMVLATGMADGMEASYARLERVLLDD